jgi:hypothetical protein
LTSSAIFAERGLSTNNSICLDDAAPRLVHGPALRVASTQSANRSHPPARFVPLVRDVIGLHDFFNHPFPRHVARSRSMRRSRPGPISSPAWRDQSPAPPAPCGDG